jgi:hypothetical protein
MGVQEIRQFFELNGIVDSSVRQVLAKAPSCTDDYKSTRDPSSYYPIFNGHHCIPCSNNKDNEGKLSVSFKQFFNMTSSPEGLRAGGKQMWWVLDGWMDGWMDEVWTGNTLHSHWYGC